MGRGTKQQVESVLQRRENERRGEKEGNAQGQPGRRGAGHTEWKKGKKPQGKM